MDRITGFGAAGDHEIESADVRNPVAAERHAQQPFLKVLGKMWPLADCDAATLDCCLETWS